MAGDRICLYCIFYQPAGSIPGRKDDPLGLCKLAESSRNEPDQPETLAYAVDYEYYGASLLVKPEFGCNQYKGE